MTDNLSDHIASAEEIIEEARNGRMFILADDEDRENEGDLIIPAQMATPDAINFMATHGRGLICLALTRERIDQLGLPMMSQQNGTRHETAFTVSIEARDGVTTGISAADRARTVAVAINPMNSPDQIVTPGHVFPLVARDGGVLVRAGHTEAAVDVARLAGLIPAGVICEIMKDDGTMARMPELIEFARRHGLKIGTIRSLISHRLRMDHLVEAVGDVGFITEGGEAWNVRTYLNRLDGSEAYVLQHGPIRPGEPTLVRVHVVSMFHDVLTMPGPRQGMIPRAMKQIAAHGSGVIVVLPYFKRERDAVSGTVQAEVRDNGIGAQVLADMGVHDMILMSNSPHGHVVGLEAYGLKVVKEVPLGE
jgi:3,4-dihydroxy 2-butanone 4-phosphate synthase/GTP cyclohydrolase II